MGGVWSSKANKVRKYVTWEGCVHMCRNVKGIKGMCCPVDFLCLQGLDIRGSTAQARMVRIPARKGYNRDVF